nr:MAG TPA: hypothetical protein [Caudoviricetes sp.]
MSFCLPCSGRLIFVHRVDRIDSKRQKVYICRIR